MILTLSLYFYTVVYFPFSLYISIISALISPDLLLSFTFSRLLSHWPFPPSLSFTLLIFIFLLMNPSSHSFYTTSCTQSFSNSCPYLSAPHPSVLFLQHRGAQLRGRMLDGWGPLTSEHQSPLSFFWGYSWDKHMLHSALSSEQFTAHWYKTPVPVQTVALTLEELQELRWALRIT